MSRLRAQDGVSLVPAIAMLAILIVLGGVALQKAVGALGHATHQGKVKRALQAADAAVDAAVYALNRADLGGALSIDPLDPGAVRHQNCVVSTGEGSFDLAALPAGGPADPQGRRWCPATGWEADGAGAEWQYRVSQLARVGTGSCGSGSSLSLDREVVAVGRSGPVRRRVRVRLRAAVSLLSGAAVQSGSATADLTMSGTARVGGSAHSNRAIVGAATNVIAGDAVPGPGSAVSGPAVGGSRTPACHRFSLPAVDAAAARADHDNGAWSTGCHQALTGLAVSCKPLLTTTGGVLWDPGARTLEVWGNGRVVLAGDTYVLCRLRLRDSGQLVVPASSPVTRVFLERPGAEACAGVPGAGQATVDGQARVVNCHPQTQPHSLQVYAVGDASAQTTQTFAGAGLLPGTVTAAVCGLNLPLAGVPMTVYAPLSHVQVGGATAIAGQVAGETVELSGAAAVQPVDALMNLNRLGSAPVLPLYAREGYLECSPRAFAELPGADPAQGC